MLQRARLAGAGGSKRAEATRDADRNDARTYQGEGCDAENVCPSGCWTSTERSTDGSTTEASGAEGADGTT